ncbi:MAG: polysulfide reductase [Desulfobacteraceae bacterium]|nr:polysulfide reductase [Desulfobacteraceae bacterium]
MKLFTINKQELPIVDHFRPDGSKWTLKEKLLLGLTFQDYRKQFFRNPVNWVVIIIFLTGIPIIIERYVYGLASVTHSSNDYPWGLFLGFGLFGMVPLSASGFLLGTTVELFGRKDFHPIERLALLNGLLGYFFAVCFLLVDLGLPWRLPYPMFVSLGPAAVLFLVAWHVATYLSVQIAEVLPSFFEWIGWLKGKKVIRGMVLGLTIAGIILSTLHQGALGALFTYAPGKVHPLWLSANFQWLHFFCSSIFGGLSMVIVVSTLCKKFLAWRCDDHFLVSLDRLTLGLAKGCVFAMITYIAIKFAAIAHDKEWVYLLTGWGQYYLFEISLAVLLPMMLYVLAIRKGNATVARVAAIFAVLGILWNRINTCLVCFNWYMYREIPHWKEVAITITVYTAYIVTYRFILYRLPILYEWKGAK